MKTLPQWLHLLPAWPPRHIFTLPTPALRPPIAISPDSRPNTSQPSRIRMHPISL